MISTSSILMSELRQVKADRDELSRIIESCHRILDLVDGNDGDTASLTPLDERLRDHLSLGDNVITDSMVNGDD